MIRIISFFFIFINSAQASPNLQSGQIIEGTKVFSDNLNKAIFYYAPHGLRIAVSHDKPDFHYTLHRYDGNAASNDEDKHTTNGILVFKLEKNVSAKLTKKIKKILTKQIGRAINLKLMPIRRFESKLNYKVVETNFEDNPYNQEGELKSDALRTSQGWSYRRFTIGLEKLSAELFWQAFQKDQLLLSLSYEWILDGVIKDDDGKWQESESGHSNTLAIQVSSHKYPMLFDKLDINQSMKAKYQRLRIICYDFSNELDVDLYMVKVEVNSTDTTGKTESKRIKFTQNTTETEHYIYFDLPKNPDIPYQYRVTRIHESGEKKTSAWTEHNGDYLDVSL